MADVEAILNQIKSRLTGNWEEDIAYVREEMIKYTEQPEVLRAVGRLIFEIMPEELRKGYEEAAGEDGANLEKSLSVVANHIRSGEIEKAEELIKELLPPPEFYKSDASTDYFSFRNPIEWIYFRHKYDHEKVIRIPNFPFDEIYQYYAFILVEQRRFDEALKIIDVALKRNPLFAGIGMEKAEIYKMTGDIQQYLSCLTACHEMVYMPPEVARYFRGLGYYFVEKSMWEEATAAYMASKLWDDSPVADQELDFIARKADRPINFDACADNWQEILGKQSVPLPPDPFWCEVAAEFAESTFEDEEYDAAGFAYSLVHALTGDKRAAERAEECRRLLDSE